MSVSGHPSPSTTALSDSSSPELTQLSLDLVAASRRNIGFLREVAECHWLHHTPVLVEAIRRYDQLWMPTVSDLTPDSGEPPMILPPLDIEWVWFCHTLNPVAYKQYCESRFSKVIGKPAIFNQENEDYALERCREIWVSKYPSESFENESDYSDNLLNTKLNHQTSSLLEELTKQRCLLTMFSKPYMLELVYLIAAKNKYKRFLFMLQRFNNGGSKFVPTSEILLMWITHKSYPTAYAIDVKEMEGTMGKIVSSGESIKKEDFEETKKVWERIFDHPYEKKDNLKPLINWEVTNTDFNVKYKPLLPRFLLEVNMFVKSTPMMMKMLQSDVSKEFIRFRLLKCHRELKINNPISRTSLNTWWKVVNLYCEFGTKGIVVELRRKGGVCVKGSKLMESKTFLWNDLLRAPSITLDREIGQRIRVLGSITPPAQALYLLKCVPDRVTDDSGAMVSEVVLKMNQYRPQEGRWLSRTVLDHAGRECFVIRMRMASGFWRRGGNKPVVVKWEDRCIEIREGSWCYVAGSIGKAPEKVIATATPKTPSQEWQASWSFSTGHELFITTTTTMSFDLKTGISTGSQVRLLKGRQMQYKKEEKNEDEDEEEGFLTIVRFTDENLKGKATGLLNWKLSAMEFLPEEDAAFVMLLCVSILRSVCEIRKEDLGNLLIRRRLKEAKHGARDWGSVIMLEDSLLNNNNNNNNGNNDNNSFLDFVRPWYWNAKAVMAPEGVDYVTKQRPVLSYSAEECGDELYKRALFG